MDDPTEIANEALDAAGIDYTIGDIEEGTRPAQVLLRRYRNCLRQLLRAAPWAFARKQEPMTILADRTGQTANVTTNVLGNQFLFEYARPPDALKMRYVPWQPISSVPIPNGNITQSNPALVQLPGVQTLPPIMPFRPARWLQSFDPNFPVPAGSDQAEEGSPVGSSVILTNVPPPAQAVYTFTAFYPSQWDSLFREAFVAYLASEVALPLNKDKKLGLAMRKDCMAIAKDKIITARATDANEAAFTSVNVPVNWMDARNSGGIGFGMWGPGAGLGGTGGCFWGGWDDCCGAGSVEGGQAY